VLYSGDLPERLRRRVVYSPSASAAAVERRGVRPCRSAAPTSAVGVEHRPHQLHQQAADWARERVPLQPLPDACAAHRDRRRARTERDAGENLVPEPPHEAEEAPETPAAAAAASRPQTRVLLNSRAAGQLTVSGVVYAGQPRTVISYPGPQFTGHTDVAITTSRRLYQRHVAESFYMGVARSNKVRGVPSPVGVGYNFYFEVACFGSFWASWCGDCLDETAYSSDVFILL